MDGSAASGRQTLATADTGFPYPRAVEEGISATVVRMLPSLVTRMILVAFSWHAILLFVAQIELRQIEPIAEALTLQHGLDRCEIAVTYREV